MADSRRFGRQRIIVVAGAAACLTSVSAGMTAVPAFAETVAAKTARATPLVEGTPCTVTAKACVDLESDRAWLVDGGKIFKGPVDISSGGKGEETPTGHSLRVYRKEPDHKSTESRAPNGQPADMPWSVFFEDGGIAFHAGSPQRASAGCVHLGLADSLAFFNFLQVGDHVQVMDGPVVAPKLSEISPASTDTSNDSDDPDAHSSAKEHDSDSDDDSGDRHRSRKHRDD
jgi:hypothetical protein